METLEVARERRLALTDARRRAASAVARSRALGDRMAAIGDRMGFVSAAPPGPASPSRVFASAEMLAPPPRLGTATATFGGIDTSPGAEVVASFSLIGQIDGQPVRATWHPHGSDIDAALLTRACLLADLRHVVATDDAGTDVLATVHGAPHAVCLTLMRACDEVVSVDIDLSPT